MQSLQLPIRISVLEVATGYVKICPQIHFYDIYCC